MKCKSIILAALLSCLCATNSMAADGDGKLTFLLTGASFAIPENGWFEIACDDMGAMAINKAVSGEAIYHTARRMNNGTFYTVEELDQTDVFVIGHVHNQNVANEQWIKENWQDYTEITTTTDYAVTYDYVIKRYIYDCQALANNPESKYYGVPGGKPVKIMLCTHWHDSRTTYNPAIRKLAERWNLPLIEFDVNIGFSKDDVNAGETQPSIAMAHDTETINGVKYGWHPLRGSNSPVQRRMAEIFTAKAVEYLGLELPFELSLSPVSPIVRSGEEAQITVNFRAGMFPYTIAYTAKDYGTEVSGLDGKPLIISATAGEKDVCFSISSATDGNGDLASDIEALSVLVADKEVAPSYDSYIHEAYKENSYATSETLQLKNGDNWSRKIYVTFPVDDIKDTDYAICFRMYFDSYTLGTFNNENRPMDGVEILEVEGNTNVYDDKLKWSIHYNHEFEPITSTQLTTDMVKSWIGWDVTAWAKEKIAAGAQHLTFRVTTPYKWRSLMNFVSSESTTTPQFAPQLLISEDRKMSAIDDTILADGVSLSHNSLNNPLGVLVEVFDLAGICRYRGSESTISLENMSKGVYIAHTPTSTIKIVK